jgi:SOS-response transcriptional repressor LexA
MSRMKLRIKAVLKKQGKTAIWLANELGVNRVTMSKYMTGKLPVTIDLLQKIADILEVPADILVVEVPDMRTVMVVGAVQAGEWAESYEWPDEEEHYGVAVPRNEISPRLTLTGLEVRGQSMNQVYPEGTVIVIDKRIETAEDLEVGRRYVVERQDGGLCEATVKTLVQDSEGRLWLRPETTEPGFESIPLFDGDEAQTIRIVGRVRYSVHRE